MAAGQNKIVYDTFDWAIYQSTHFDVYHYSREKGTLQKVVSMAESAYDELSRRLNYQIPKRIPIIYYSTHAEFEQNNVELNFIPEGVGAFAEPARNRMVLPIDVPDEKLQALVQHELTHIFQYEILFGGRLSRALTSNAADVVHGGDGLLLRERRRRQGPDVPEGRRELGPHPADHEGPDRAGIRPTATGTPSSTSSSPSGARTASATSSSSSGRFSGGTSPSRSEGRSKSSRTTST